MKRIATKTALALVASSVFGLHSTVFGADLLDNTSKGTVALAGTSFISTTQDLSIVFSTGATAYDLTSLTMGILNDTVRNVSFEISLYHADANNIPIGPALATLPINQNFPVNNTYYNFVPIGFTIAANTKYALVAENSDAVTGFGWSPTSTGLPPTASGGLTFLEYKYFNGTIWQTNDRNEAIWLQGTPVPEPSSYILGCVTILISAVVAGRKKRSRA